MKCDRCGRRLPPKRDGGTCRDCSSVIARTRSSLSLESEFILRDGYWYNDNGIQRWRSF